MRSLTRKIAYVGGLDCSVSELLREYGYRLESISGESIVALARALYKLKPAALHARQFHFKAATVARLMGIPLVVEAGREDTNSSTARAARIADRTICAGSAVRESLLQLGAPSSSTVVMRSLVNSNESGAATFSPMLDPNTRWVVAASPCDGPDRGHQDLLLAFIAVARTRPKLKLLIAGEGPEAQRLRAQAESAGMLKRVVVHAVGACQLPSIFAHAAAMVGPSRAGGSPDPVPEALAVGAAVIATGVGSHPVWIREGRTGWLVPPRSPAALSHRLAQVLDDVELGRRVGNAAQKAAAEVSTPRAVAQELARCYAVVARSPAALPRLSMYLPDRPLSRA
jgi:glycosyltransferase involved in cell wall biosynthesis